MWKLSVAALIVALAANAQLTQATLTGTITDKQGSAIGGAFVIATHKDTGTSTRAETNESGAYTLSPLPIGLYRVTVEKPGFRKQETNDLELTSGQVLEFAAVLDVGNVTDTVTVQENGSLLETRSSESATLIETKSVEDIPLGDRRAMNLIKITGAAVFVGYESGGRPNFVLAGGRAQSQMVFLDGGSAQNMRLGIGQLDLDAPAEALQEVRVLANAFSAEYGGTASGVVIANTKSGTNRFRGSLFEYFRNQVLDAPNFFSPIVDDKKQKPSLRYNVFGGTIGGPVRKDKTFFFFAYEGSRRRDGTVRTLTVPSALERAGDFSQTRNARGVAVIYDPLTGRTQGTAVIRDAFAGNRIPASRIDPVSAKLIPFYPVANRAADDVTGANNFRANDVNALTRDFYMLKVDHQISSKDRVAARYLTNTDINARKSVFTNPASDTINAGDNFQRFYYGAWTRIVNPSLVHEFRFTYGRRKALTFARGGGENWPSKLGLTYVSDDFFPQVSAGGYTALGSATHERRQMPIQQFQYIDNISLVRGKSTWKAGAELRPSLNYEIFRPDASGSFTFNRGLTGLPGNAFTGNGFATLLTGQTSNITIRETDILDRRTVYYAAFVQNDWNVHRSLTLNIGLRWEYDSPIRDLNNRFNGFDGTRINPVSGTPGVVRFGGLDGYRTTPYNADRNNFAPRFGFAWQPGFVKGLVVRSAYGIFFAHPFDRAVANAVSLGFEKSATLVTADNYIGEPITFLSAGRTIQARAPTLDGSFGAVQVGRAPTQAVTFFDENRRTGYSQQFNFGVQKELPGRAVLEGGYIGNLSRKLTSANLNLNQIHPDRVRLGSTQAFRPFPQYSGATIIAPAFGVSSYHAGLLKFNKRFARSFNVQATYTWSKFLDNSDSGGGGKVGNETSPYSNLYNRRNDWGPSENDINHRLTWSSVVQLPLGKNVFARGWSTGIVAVLQSGGPVTVTTLTNTTNMFTPGALRANVVRDPNLPVGERTIARWFDTEAFSQPAQYQFGNQGIGLIRADGVINFNASLLRNFAFAERKTLQFRGEFFNLANHANFLLPGSQFEGPGFGIINAARPGRQVQLGIRLVF